MDPPEVPEAVALRQWWDQGGAAAPAEALSRQGGGPRSDRRITLAQIKEDGLGLGEKPDWVMVSACLPLAGQGGRCRRCCWRCRPPAAASPGANAYATPALRAQASCAITYLRSENMSYPSCPNKIDGGRQCNKKLQDQQNDGNTTCVLSCAPAAAGPATSCLPGLHAAPPLLLPRNPGAHSARAPARAAQVVRALPGPL